MDLGELTEEHGVLISTDRRPGHMPMHMIQEHMQSRWLALRGSFLYYGDSSYWNCSGYDHLSSAIGAAMIGWYGCSMLCYAPEHSQFSFVSGDNSKNSYWEGAKRGMMAYKIAAHAADLSKDDTSLDARLANLRRSLI